MNVTDAVRQLDSADSPARQEAADFLSRQAEAIRPVAAALVRHVGDADRIVAEYCVAALEELGAVDESQLPELAVLLSSPEADVVYWAATLLGRAKEGGASHANELLEVIRVRQDISPRRRAAWALRQMGPAAGSIAPKLEALQSGQPPEVEREIAAALAAIKR